MVYDLILQPSHGSIGREFGAYQSRHKYCGIDYLYPLIIPWIRQVLDTELQPYLSGIFWLQNRQ